MLHTRTIVLLLVGLVVLVNAQTFQYSRGWTNGKRSSSSPSSSSLSAVEPLANQLLASGMTPGGLSSLKPSEKALLRRFLRNPCDLRVASLLAAAHPSKELFPGLAGNNFDSTESAGATFVLPPFLMDPDEGNGNGGIASNLPNGRPMEDELRFKRDATTIRQKIA
uniref:Pro-corazonin n=1 Tax=Anopheles christyi TaxID=43041 RepID=A0A182K8M8_9DIPT